MLELLRGRYGQESVSADRGLFESAKDWRKRYKTVYGQAEAVYILAREDGTVGLGIWKQWKYLQKQGVLMMLMFADAEAKLSEDTEYTDFGVERIEQSEGSEQDLARFALVTL